MKKLLAVLLSLVMLLAFVPAVIAEDADYTLVIEGGNVNENLEVVGGKNLLAVKVALNEAVEETIFGLTFDITYDASQVTYVDFKADDVFAMPTVNGTEEGIVRCALVSVEGIPAAETANVITLYFELTEDMEAGTEIAFGLANDAFAETTDAAKPVHHDIAAAFEPFIVTEGVPFTGVVKFNEGEVKYKGTTPYIIYDSSKEAFEPAFTVYEEDGETVIGPENYDYEYKENTLPGTAYLFVYFKGEYSGEAMIWFKIYLPATKQTKVENIAAGIRITWAPVDGAAGYVIYRRAWSTTTNGWTNFERWWNVTGTEWVDGSDAAHGVYAGTRYQYGVKAYFERRLDPVAGTEIGGNVNDPSGNYNLGEVGPLKTTVRITTRVLNEVEAGRKKITVKWAPSGVFTGTEIVYATDANFSDAVTVKVDCRDANNQVNRELVITGLTSGKTYYVRVRSYHEFEGFTYVGEWSNVLTGTVK